MVSDLFKYAIFNICNQTTYNKRFKMYNLWLPQTNNIWLTLFMINFDLLFPSYKKWKGNVETWDYTAFQHAK